MFWYRMYVVTGGGRIYRFGENKRVELNLPHPATPVCVSVCEPVRVGKARTCTVLCTHSRFAIKYSLAGGVSAEKYSRCCSSSEGYLM